MDEALQNLYNEIRKIIIKDNLKLMKDTSHEYITAAGEAFLDGLQVNGECIEIVSKDKYDLIVQELKELKQNKKQLIISHNKEISFLMRNTNSIKRKKKFLNLF